MFFGAKSTVEFIAVGLGNPGKKYEGTRHNAGFCALDNLAQRWDIAVTKSKFDALYGTGSVNGHKIMLLKPQTFMNASGIAVQKAAAFYKVPPQNIIVLFDDISLAPGRLRVRLQGSAGGHNGIKSIIGFMGQDFPRVKIGVGEKPNPQYDLADWVLGHLTEAERKSISARYDDAAKACELIMDGKAAEAMNLCNG